MWITRLMHVAAYIVGIFMIATTLLSALPIYEQIFRTGLVLYLSVIYIEFVDGSILRRLKLSVLFEDEVVRNGYDDLESLMRASHRSLYLMRLIQQSETEFEREDYTGKLAAHVDSIKELKLPKKHRKDQTDILREVEGFLEGRKGRS